MKRVVSGSVMVLALCGMLAAQQKMPQTTKQTIKTGSIAATETATGTLLAVGDGTLVVKMTTGEVRTFTPPADLKYMIDGKPLSISELKVGTRLTGTITRSATTLTERTTTVGSGKVWFVSGTNVILTLPNGENRQYKVNNDYKFTVEGKPATVFDLRKGMVVSAQKIVEEPQVVLSAERTVTGTAPAPLKPVVAETRSTLPAPKPAPTQVAAAPAPVPAELPARLPKTGSELPLIGLLGALCGAGSLLLRRARS